MWRAVPQVPVLWTRNRTSLMPTTGRGTSRRSRPGAASVLTSASMSAPSDELVEVVGVEAGILAIVVVVIVIVVVIDVGPVDNRVLNPADAVDLAADAVARHEVDGRISEDADARRRAGRDDVARIERDRPADERDERGHAPDHVGRRPLLHQHPAAVVRTGARDAVGAEAEVLRVRDLVRREEDRAHGRDSVARFG